MRFFIFTFWTFLIASCGNKTFRFSDSDFDWVCYKGVDTLIFISNTGDIDTLFVKKGERYMDVYEPQALNPDSIEKFFVPYYFSNDTTRYLGKKPLETLLAMTKTIKNKTKVGFGVVTNDAFFYGLKYYDIAELEKQNSTAFKLTQSFIMTF